MLRDPNPNRAVLAEEAASPLGPLHGKSLQNPSPLFGFHVACQGSTSALYIFGVCSHFPFILGSFTFIFKAFFGGRSTAWAVSPWLCQAVSLGHWQHQPLLPGIRSGSTWSSRYRWTCPALEQGRKHHSGAKSCPLL